MVTSSGAVIARLVRHELSLAPTALLTLAVPFAAAAETVPGTLGGQLSVDEGGSQT